MTQATTTPSAIHDSPFVPPVLVGVGIGHLPCLPHEVLEVLPINRGIKGSTRLDTEGSRHTCTSACLSVCLAPLLAGEAWEESVLRGNGRR